MAYGKIKADTLVYDNSGTDTDVTISSLAAKADLNSPTFTGTAVFNDLTVNGTTTTVNSTTLTVDDKNIELGTVDTPTDTTADGGGITLKGATDKKITWNNAQDAWIFNQDIVVETGVVNVKGVEGGTATIHFNADEGDDNADIWRIQANTSGNFTISTYSTGSYVAGLQVNSNGNIVGAGSISDSKGDLRSIPQNSQGAYTLVASDAGKHILSTGTVTVPNAVFSAGDAVTIVNNTASDLTITKTINTMYNAADGTSANRTLAARGVATILFTSGTLAYISGAGLS